MTVAQQPDYIEFKEVEKTFSTKDGELTAIQSLSMSIANGEFLAVVGPSGCGKSTLLMALAGLTSPTRGTVDVRGTQVSGPQTDAGIVFQSAELLSWRTALDNIMLQAEIRKMDKSEARSRARKLMTDVGLEGFEDAYPDELSGGMQQRVALCRALLHDPGMILLDEPLGALDAITRDQVQTDLQHLWMESRATVLLITHSIEEAVFLADRVIVLSPRPASIAADIRIDLPRPRHLADRGSTEFTGLVNQIRDEFSRLGVFTDAD